MSGMNFILARTSLISAFEPVIVKILLLPPVPVNVIVPGVAVFNTPCVK